MFNLRKKKFPFQTFLFDFCTKQVHSHFTGFKQKFRLVK